MCVMPLPLAPPAQDLVLHPREKSTDGPVLQLSQPQPTLSRPRPPSYCSCTPLGHLLEVLHCTAGSCPSPTRICTAPPPHTHTHLYCTPLIYPPVVLYCSWRFWACSCRAGSSCKDDNSTRGSSMMRWNWWAKHTRSSLPNLNGLQLAATMPYMDTKCCFARRVSLRS